MRSKMLRGVMVPLFFGWLDEGDLHSLKLKRIYFLFKDFVALLLDMCKGNFSYVD